MIVAGRGRRLDIGDQPKSVGTPGMDSVDRTADLSTLKEKINQINPANLNSVISMVTCNLFNQLCSSKETMRDILKDLHDEALYEADFGEKLVAILEQMSNLEVNGVSLRGELLTLIQKDFEMKETMCKSDPKKFVNAVMLLGGVYNRFKVCGTPIAVLGIALLDYFDLLIKGGQEELKTLTKQVLINGKTLSEAPTYDQFKFKLRDVLINGSSNTLSKCWILLILDLISNDLRPLQGSVNEFYTSNLTDDYIKLVTLLPSISSDVNHSSQSRKSAASTSAKNFESDFYNVCNTKRDLTKKFSDITIKTEGSNFKVKKDKNQISLKKNSKRDNWKQNIGMEASPSGHDDRFVKDEDYYGVQMPRQPKPESKKFTNIKNKKKEFNE